jgi:serine/threonine protein kinase
VNVNRSLLNQRYVRLRKLAEGGMGEIFLARQTGVAGFQREVVLKVIRKELSDHPRAVEMFLSEARLAAALSHPNVVQIYDVGQEEGSYFIVMERVSGSDLRTLAEATTRQAQMIPMELAVNIILQVLEGLRYAHTFRDETGRPLKIVHRDISPPNILISADGAVKVADFGIARAEDQLYDETGMRPGKFAYMSPEMVRGEPVDARSDLFSVGVMLYELTVGQRLFRAPTFEAMRRVVDEPIPPPTFSRAGYPVDLEILVMRALERNSADRFGSAEEMLDELEQFAFNTGLRVSRLRLGRFVSRVMGMSGSALEVEEGTTTEEPGGEVVGEDLDFDHREPFHESAELSSAVAPSGEQSVSQERVRRVMQAVQQANEAIAELVAASDEEEPEEGSTLQMPGGEQATLRARTVGPTREGTVVVTAEQVEEEIDLGSQSQPEVTQELSLEEAIEDELEDRSEPLVLLPREAIHRERSDPEPSAELKAALADISAELKAAAASDRRRGEALAHALELIDDVTPVPLREKRPISVDDELERTDGEPRRRLDELELVDLHQHGTADADEEELEADGETIVLDEDSSAFEVYDGAMDARPVNATGPLPATSRPPPVPPASDSPPAAASSLTEALQSASGAQPPPEDVLGPPAAAPVGASASAAPDGASAGAALPAGASTSGSPEPAPAPAEPAAPTGEAIPGEAVALTNEAADPLALPDPAAPPTATDAAVEPMSTPALRAPAPPDEDSDGLDEATLEVPGAEGFGAAVDELDAPTLVGEAKKGHGRRRRKRRGAKS